MTTNATLKSRSPRFYRMNKSSDGVFHKPATVRTATALIPARAKSFQTAKANLDVQTDYNFGLAQLEPVLQQNRGSGDSSSAAASFPGTYLSGGGERARQVSRAAQPLSLRTSSLGSSSRLDSLLDPCKLPGVTHIDALLAPQMPLLHQFQPFRSKTNFRQLGTVLNHLLIIPKPSHHPFKLITAISVVSEAPVSLLIPSSPSRCNNSMVIT
jgi:hypothetical protein